MIILSVSLCCVFSHSQCYIFVIFPVQAQIKNSYQRRDNPLSNLITSLAPSKPANGHVTNGPTTGLPYSPPHTAAEVKASPATTRVEAPHSAPRDSVKHPIPTTQAYTSIMKALFRPGCPRRLHQITSQQHPSSSKYSYLFTWKLEHVTFLLLKLI